VKRSFRGAAGAADISIEMADPQRGSVIFYDHGGCRRFIGSGWPVIAVMAIGAILVLGNLAGLLAGSHMDTFGSSTGNGLAGAQLVGLALGIGLVMRKELARRVYLVFAVIGLVLTVISSSSYAGSFASYILGVGLDIVTLALLIHASVKRAFD
jgi:hypothetical protein